MFPSRGGSRSAALVGPSSSLSLRRIEYNIRINSVLFSAKVHQVGEVKKVGESSVCTLRVHQNYAKKKDEQGNVTEWGTEWVNVECWNRAAEAAQRLEKKEEVIIEGRLAYSEWKSKDGGNRSELKIKASFIHRTKSQPAAAAIDQPPSGVPF